METELPHLMRTKQRSNASSCFVEAVERRNSGWQTLGSGGLRGGMMEGGGARDASYVEVKVREKQEPPRNVMRANLGEERGCQGRESSHEGMQVDSNIDYELAFDYGSEGIELDEMLVIELSRAEQNYSDETNILEQGEMTESKDPIEGSEEVDPEAESEGDEEASDGMKFLKELDRDYMCSSRLIVRGEYQGMVNGKVYTLIVRRKTEGTYVDWSLYNLDTTEQLLSMKGEMTYPYELTKKTRGPEGKIYGQKVKGGWAWGGWAYGFVNLSGISGSFPNDARDVHIDMMEAVFWDSEVSDLYHVCGPNCKKESKAEDLNCSEGGCGLRVWSIMIKTFTIAEEEHDLRPTSYRKEKEVQTVFMSLVRFFSGHFKLVIHTDQRLRRYDEELIWMSPVPNSRYRIDTVAGVDYRLRERAEQIYKTRVSAHVDDQSGEMVQVRLLNVLLTT